MFNYVLNFAAEGKKHHQKPPPTNTKTKNRAKSTRQTTKISLRRPARLGSKERTTSLFMWKRRMLSSRKARRRCQE